MTDRCEYCGSHCTDSRGNCGACGAPKHEEDNWNGYNRIKVVSSTAAILDPRPWYIQCADWNTNLPHAQPKASEKGRTWR